MDFAQASKLATAWVDIISEGCARIVREETISKPYGGYSFIKATNFWTGGLSLRRSQAMRL
jgi:hypothetical protein